ncbi:MAG TPA: hypothetical protein VD862_00130 [Candidatus Paceibacterota bacterium]|nr:hypothetical protein [Candidatus Paceibacterota bacterium]
MRTSVPLTVLSFAVAGLVMLTAVSAHADDGKLGKLRPSLDAAFTAGVTDEHNSIGLALGTHIALAELGRFRLIAGGDVGFTSVCRADGRSLVPGANDPCGDHMNGFAQIKGGLEVLFGGQRDHANRVISDIGFHITPTYLVAGPFRGNAGLNFGIGIRWRN